MTNAQHGPGHGGHDGPARRVEPAAEPSLAELVRRLGDDSGALIRHEMALAKGELREMASARARDAAKIGVAAGLALAGLLALTAFGVLALGAALESYWLAALLVGLALMAVGAMLVRSAVGEFRNGGLKPQQTIDSLRQDARWVEREAAEVKRKMTR